MDAAPDQFQPVTTPAPDWSAAANWSEKAIPAAGSAAVIAGAAATIDPGVTLAASLALEPGQAGSAALIGNGGAFTLGEAGMIAIGSAGTMTAGLFAADSLVNQGLISVTAGSRLDVVVQLGAVTGQAGGPAPSFSNQGTITVGQGALLEVAGTEFRNTGGIILDGGTLDVAGGNVVDAGYVQLEHNAIARFSDGVEFQTFDFGSLTDPGGQGGTISLDDPWIGPGVTLANFGAGDEIDLTSEPQGQVRIGDCAITLLDGNGAVEGRLTLATPLAPGDRLTAIPAGGGSAIISVTAAAPETAADPPCFAAGSRILTPAGYRPVETLAAGDAVVLASGGTAAIAWTGRRRLDIARHPRPERVRPVRLAAGALAPGIPARALRLSPDHALYLEGVLVPVKHLVNGATILREARCEAVTYHHLELARHGVILAEGAPCETYLDTGNRAGFEAAGVTRHRRWDEDGCAPLCTGGPALRAIRQGLLSRARAIGFTVRVLPEITLRIDGASMPRAAAARVTFPLAARHGATALLCSASFHPAEFSSASDDWRRLGIALSGVSFGPGPIRPPVTRRGFHPRAKGDASLWTDGAGEILIPPGARDLTLHIGALPQGWLPPPGSAARSMMIGR